MRLTNHNALAGPVERVLAAKRLDLPSRGNAAADAPVRELEQEIDDRVYRLYGLTKDEIKLVESASAEASA